MGENGTEVGKIFLRLKINSSGVEESMNSVKDRAKKLGQKVVDAFSRKKPKEFNDEVKRGESSVQRMTSAVKRFGKAVLAAFTLKALLDFGKKCVGLASDLTEVENVVSTAFPNMYAYVDDFAKGAREQFGLSETMAKNYIGTFGAMAQAFGFTEKQAAAMSTTLTGLAGDVASFYNISQDAAYTKLKSVFTGETESLKELGIVMTQTALDSYALSNGFGKTVSAMSEAEKVALRYSFVQSKLSMAQGDVARTANSWANQVRLLKVNIQTLGSMVGQLILKALSPLIQVINLVMGKLIDLGNAFATLFGGKSRAAFKQAGVSLGGVSGSVGEISDGYGNAAKGASKAAKGSDKLGKSLKKAAKAARSLMGFDQINKVSEKQSSSAGSGAGGAGGGAGGISGGGISGAALNIDTSGIDSFQKKVEKKLGPLWTNLIISLSRCGKAFQELGKVIRSAIDWVWKNILKPFGTWIITALAPALVDVLTGAIKIVTAAMKAMGPVFQVIWNTVLKPIAKAIGNVLVAALKLLAGWLDNIAAWIDRHPKLFAGITTALIGMVAAFKAFTFIRGLVGIFRAVSEAMGGLSAVAGVLTSPIGLVVAGLAGLVAAGILVYKNWDKIKKKWKQFTEVFQKQWEKLQKKLEPVGKKLTEIVGSLKDKWEGIKSKSVELVAEAKEKAEGALEWLSGKWESIKDRGATLLAEAKEKTKGAIDSLHGMWEGIKDRGATLLAEAKEKASGAIEKLHGAWEGIQDRTAQLKAEAVTKAAEVKGWCEERLGEWKGAARDLSMKAATAADTVKSWCSSRLKEWTGKASDLSMKAATAADTVKSWCSSRLSEWKGAARDLSMNAATAANTVKSWCSSRLKEWTGKASDLSMNAVNAANTVKDWCSARLKVWTGKASDLSMKAATAADTVKDWCSDRLKVWTGKTTYLNMKVNTTAEKLKGELDKIMKGIKARELKISLKFSAAASDLKKWINTNVIDRVNAKFKSVPILKNHLIPRLAEGGYLSKNTPQLAMVGDNRHQGEYVAPEKKLEAMADRAASGAAGAGNGEILALLRLILTAIQDIDPDVYLDGKTIKDNIVRRINNNTRATGVCEIIT